MLNPRSSRLLFALLILIAGALTAYFMITVKPQRPKTTPEEREFPYPRAQSGIREEAVPIPEHTERGTAVSQERLETGRRLINETKKRSRETGRYAIIVDKSAYSLQVYKGGELVDTYPIELGSDPVNPKRQRGDGRTPEGKYRVTWRRDIGQTIFHRAFLIDFPNAEDQRLGYTGSFVEIHGSGSGQQPTDGGYNWTDGCVALSDEDMDALFDLQEGRDRIGTGTPVTIVFAGTLKDDEYKIVEASLAAE